jgi:hypothetical protein
MSQEKGFTYYTDPAHGWVCVTLDDLRSIGLKPADFTLYSYRNGNELYLEEDKDAMKFIYHWNEKYKEPPLFYEQHIPTTENFIRRFPHNDTRAALGYFA